jgi:hypothetical protein
MRDASASTNSTRDVALFDHTSNELLPTIILLASDPYGSVVSGVLIARAHAVGLRTVCREQPHSGVVAKASTAGGSAVRSGIHGHGGEADLRIVKVQALSPSARDMRIAKSALQAKASDEHRYSLDPSSRGPLRIYHEPVVAITQR